MKRFAELDAMRGFAALGVALYHYTRHASRYFGHFPHLAIGQYGVQLFFCVSGFVIFWTLQRSRRLRDFAFSRFSRLYPAYWVALAVSIILTLFHAQRPWLTGYAVNATMLQKFTGVPDVDAVFWTLAIELVFYLWMAGIYATKQLGQMPGIALGWLALSAVTAFFNPPAWIDTYFIVSAIPYFMAGAMFYLISQNGWKRLYVVVILCALADAGLRGWDGLAVAAVVFGVFSAAVAGRLRWIANPATTWLGAISYTLYLTHRNLGYELLFALHRHGVPSWASIVLTLGLALLIASLITYGVERPAMSVLRGWWHRRQGDLHAPTQPASS